MTRPNRRRQSEPSKKDRAAAPAGRSYVPAALAALLVLMVLVAFGRVLGHKFVDWDDVNFIVHNPAYNPPTAAGLANFWVWRADVGSFYVPVLYSTWWVTALVARDPAAPGGPLALRADPFDPAPFHALNLLAHAAAAVLAFFLIRRLLRRDKRGTHARPTNMAVDGPALVGAAVFALHPLQVEAVAWASTFYTSASVAIALAAAVCYLRFGDRRGTGLQPVIGHDQEGRAATSERAWAWYAGATLLFAASLLTKPSMVLLPIFLLGAEVLLLGRSRREVIRSALLLLPWLGLGAVIAVVTSRYRQDAGMIFHPTPPQRLLVAADALGFYLRQIVWPVGLVPDYGRTPQRALADTTPAVAWAVVLAGLTVGVAAVARRLPWAAMAWLTFLVGVAATLGLVTFEYQLYSTVADRYVYFSLLGVGLLVAAGVHWFVSPRPGAAAPRFKPAPVYATAAAVLLVLGGLAFRQVGFWADNYTLFNRALEVRPDSLAAHRALQVALTRDNRFAEALHHGRQAIAAHPRDPRLWRFQAAALMDAARADRGGPSGPVARRLFDEAAAHLREALTLTKGREDEVYAALGSALAQGGRHAEAEAALRESIRLNDKAAEPRRNLTVVYRETGRPDEAVREAEAALAIDPASEPLRGMVGQLRAERDGRRK